MAAEGARASHRAKEAENMARDCGNLGAARDFAFDIGYERLDRRLGRRTRCRLTKHQRIDAKEAPRLAISGPSHHDAVDRAEVIERLFEAGDAAVENDREAR